MCIAYNGPMVPPSMLDSRLNDPHLSQASCDIQMSYFATNDLSPSVKALIGADKAASLDADCTLIVAIAGEGEFAGLVQVAPRSVHAQTRATVGDIPEIQRLQSALGNGVGTRLMRAAEWFAAYHHEATAVVLHVQTHDERLRNFYLKQGFHPLSSSLISCRSGEEKLVTPYVKRLASTNYLKN